MKRLRKYQALIFCITIILSSSCSSTNSSTNSSTIRGLIVDVNNPPEQNVLISLPYSFFLKKWNGINIEKHLSRVNGRLFVPAGNNKMIFDVSYYYYLDKETYTFKNVELQYDFEAGKKYWIDPSIWTTVNDSKILRFNVELYIRLYDTTEGRRRPVLLKQWIVTRLWYPYEYDNL
jgi:hypothetical protein